MGDVLLTAVRPPWGPEDMELHLTWHRVGGAYVQFVCCNLFVIFAGIIAKGYEFQDFGF